MTKFDKDQFNYFGGYLTYGQYPERPKFIARFKYSSRDKAGFMSFLIKNFTVEEYLGRLEAGETPVGILESKGYVSATVKKILKEAGFEPTIVGKRQYLNQIDSRYAA